MKSFYYPLLAAAIFVLICTGLFFDFTVHAADPYTLIGWSEYGMQSVDSDYSIFSLSPPYNTIHAQLIDAGGKLIKTGDAVTITYAAAADPVSGAMNSTSDGKTNFWQYAATLFNFSGIVDAGLSGNNMPGAVNTPQAMTFDPTLNRFSARGIPLTPSADQTLVKNYYPLMKLVARDSSGVQLASTTITLPVSDEVSCRACHASNGLANAMPADGWVNDPDPEHDFRLNILLKHDELNLRFPSYQDALAATGYSPDGLYATATGGTPVLCVNCHSSNAPALNAPGIAGIEPLTTAMHTHHAVQPDPVTGVALDDQNTRDTCYLCHPGPVTKALRGVMGHSVAADGTMAVQCQSCHGNLSALGDPNRQGWLSLPNCQACHTGTATTAIEGQLRNTSVFDSGGNMVTPTDTTFATTPNQPSDGFSLFRASTGHGGLMCQSCHGSTHAEYPGNANDNLQSIAIQGVASRLGECTSCHKTGISSTTGGPHGMHQTGPSWVSQHQNAARKSTACTPCHGTDYRGTVLSRSFTTQTLAVGRGTVAMFPGYQVSCYTCHNGPSGSGNAPATPSVSDASTSATSGQPAAISITVTGGSVLRIVTQPASGTAFITGNTITYTPAADFQGTDAVTYAAILNGKDSNLGTATIQVSLP